MNYKFEKFTAVGSKYVIGITIAKPGGLSMSSGFYNKYAIEKYASADLYYDNDAKAVAIKFFEKVDEGIFKLKHREGGKGGYISSISFVKRNGLEKYFGKRKEPKVHMDEKIGKVFVIDLDQE